MVENRGEVTALLHRWSEGDPTALEVLLPLVVDDLRAIARGYLHREGSGHTLQPTALVNELYLTLTGRRTVVWNNSDQFFRSAAEFMRRILVDYARRKSSAKRGGGVHRVSLDWGLELGVEDPEDIAALNEAMVALGRLDPRQARVVELRFFFGLTNSEIARVLAVSTKTVSRDWAAARLWLYRELKSS